MTPQRGSQASHGQDTLCRCPKLQDSVIICPDAVVAPLTPLANLKVLAEASSAMEGRQGGGGGEAREGGGGGEGKEAECAKQEVCGGGGEEEGGMAGRKMKSLSVLCKK